MTTTIDTTLPASLRREKTTPVTEPQQAASDTPATTEPTGEAEKPAKKTKRDRQVQSPAKIGKALAKMEARAAAKAAAKTEKTARKAKLVDESDESDESDEPVRRRSIVPVRFKQAYSQHNDTCGDTLALTFKAYTTTTNSDGREALDLQKLREVAEANGLGKKLDAYERLNNGQKRMNIGNLLRGALKNGAKVVIGKRTFANAAKALAKEEQKQAA